MFNGSRRIARIGGSEILVHWSAVLVAVVLVAGLARQVGLVPAAFGIVAFFGSILAHELAHARVARHYGIGTPSIELWALGGMARLDRESPSPRAEGFIAAAGPLASLGVAVVGAAGALLVAALGGPASMVTVLAWIAFVNALLAVFNLLPGAPLDGGRIVRAVRWAMHGDRYRASRDAGKAGQVIGWGLAGVGVWLMLNGMPSIWLIITGAFIAINAKAEIMSSYVSERLAGVRVRDVTWFGVAEADEDTDADTMLWQRSRLGSAGAVAVRGRDGQLDGLVTEDQLWAIPAEQRPWVALDSVMVPFSKLAVADPDEQLADVLSRLDPLRPVLTVWRDGRLLGVVPPARLRQRLSLRPT